MSAEPDWDAIIARIDVLAATAAVCDRSTREIGVDELAIGFTELAKLRHGGEPDYSARGLGTAYLLYYLAKRAVNAAAACASLGEMPGSVRVLDIGAGTNAAAVALSVMYPSTTFAITAVEPSPEMAAAGEAVIAGLQNVSIGRVPATLDDLLDQSVLPGMTFDLVVMSALLPYKWRKYALADRVVLGEQLLARLLPGALLLVIEPRAKLEELEAFAACLDRTGIEYGLEEVHAIAGPERILRTCSAQLVEWFPALSRSGWLSEQARERLESDSMYSLRTGNRFADVALYGTHRIGVSVPRSPYGRARQSPVHSAQPGVDERPTFRQYAQRAADWPGAPRTRVHVDISLRTWVTCGAAAMAACAAIAFGFAWLM